MGDRFLRKVVGAKCRHQPCRAESAKPDQAEMGMPEGLIQPMLQASSTNKNTVMDNPTRTARARAMAGLRVPGSDPLRSMKTPAPAKETSTATSINTMRVFMRGEYFTAPAGVRPC